jgi:hypothetical protein
MALVGVNIALMYTGQEKVLLEVYKQAGVDLTNASGDLDYFNGPAYLSWSRGQSQASTGGLDVFHNASAGASGGALPSWWFAQQAALGRRQAQMMRALGITTILRGFENNVPGQLKALYPEAKITQIGSTAWALDALDPLFAKLADEYMRRLIAEFGTDHYYQADGFFNSKKGPWLDSDSNDDRRYQTAALQEAVTRPACKFSGALNMTHHLRNINKYVDQNSGLTEIYLHFVRPILILMSWSRYIKNCPGATPNNCKPYMHKTLGDAQSACAALDTCGGVTLQRGEYSLRAHYKTTPAPPKEPSTSWLITNPTCHPPPAPPPPPPPPPSDMPAYKAAAAHSAAAYAGLTRTDPKAVWVYLFLSRCCARPS